jgi:hypothetical protein
VTTESDCSHLALTRRSRSFRGSRGLLAKESPAIIADRRTAAGSTAHGSMGMRDNDSLGPMALRRDRWGNSGRACPGGSKSLRCAIIVTSGFP